MEVFLTYVTHQSVVNIFHPHTLHFDLSQKAIISIQCQAKQALHATACDWLKELGTFSLLAENVPNLLLLHLRLLGAHLGHFAFKNVPPKLLATRLLNKMS